MSSRPKIPDAIAVALLVANHHTCCICNTPHKHVQVHHIDGNNSNHDPSNLAVVCMDCHSRVTGDEGLGRHFSEKEVRVYKRQWELECSGESAEEDEDEEDSLEEPVSSIYQSRFIRSGEHYHREFEMESGQQFVASVTTDDYIDVSVCDLSEYQKWVKNNDFMEYDGDEEVRECELSFVAPNDGVYVLLLINDGDEDVDATIDAAIWDEEDED